MQLDHREPGLALPDWCVLLAAPLFLPLSPLGRSEAELSLSLSALYTAIINSIDDFCLWVRSVENCGMFRRSSADAGTILL